MQDLNISGSSDAASRKAVPTADDETVTAETSSTGLKLTTVGAVAIGAVFASTLVVPQHNPKS